MKRALRGALLGLLLQFSPIPHPAQISPHSRVPPKALPAGDTQFLLNPRFSTPLQCELPDVEWGDGRGFNPWSVALLTLCDLPGYQVNVEPLLRDPGFPPESQLEAWRGRMRIYVPFLLKALSTDCWRVRVEAESLLDKIVEERDVPGLERLLQRRNDGTLGRAWIRYTLIYRFHRAKCLPFLLEALGNPEAPPEVLNKDIDTTLILAPDSRVFQALCGLSLRFQNPSYGSGLIMALVRHSPGPEGRSCLSAAFSRFAQAEPLPHTLDTLASALADEEHFDQIAEFLLGHPGLKERLLRGMLYSLRTVGCERYRAFLRAYHPVPQQATDRAYVAMQYLWCLEEPGRRVVLEGRDVLDWLQEEAGELLPSAPDSSILPFLARSPDAAAKAPPERRAAYWERVLRAFPGHPEIERHALKRLYDAYGPEGTRDFPKALEAISRANQLELLSPATGVSRHAPWEREEKDLRHYLTVQKALQGLRLERAHPMRFWRPTGPWQADLVLPSEVSFDLSQAPVFAFLEVWGQGGLLEVVPARVSLRRQGPPPPKAFRVTVEPLEKACGPRAPHRKVFLRLLFLPEHDGFQGSIRSEGWAP